MADQKPTAQSIQQRVNAILNNYKDREKVFASQAGAEEVEELEYLLARAEGEMREVQGRVELLRKELEKKRAGLI